jgi:hypothetical protein
MLFRWHYLLCSISADAQNNQVRLLNGPSSVRRRDGKRKTARNPLGEWTLPLFFPICANSDSAIVIRA